MRNLLHNFSLFSFLFFAFNLISPNNGAPVAGRRTIEGDIVGESIKTLKVAGDKAKAKANLLWPNATVPYLLFTEYSDWQKKQIETAIKGFDVTCVRFVPRTTEDDYLLISPGARECSAEIGNKRNGVQIVSLVPDCIQQLGTIQHELMHSLGFYHEQARSDRDNYVDISWDHIREDGKDQFFSYNFNTDDYPYDFGSVMHYDKFAFSRNSERNYWTLRPQPKYVKQAAQDSPTGEIGQRAGLSPKDIQKIRAMYKCDEKKMTVEEKPADTAGATMEPAKAETEMTTKPKPSKIQATTRNAALVTAAQTSSAYDYEDDVSSGATVTSEVPEIKTTRAGRKKTTTEAKNVVDTTILSTTEATRTVPQTATTPSHEDSTTTPPSDYEDEISSAATVTMKTVEAKTTRKGRQTTRIAPADDHENNFSGGATVTSEIPKIKTTRAGRKKTTTETKNVVDTTILSTTEATRTVPQTATTPSHEDSTTTPPSDYEDEPTSAATVTMKTVEAKTTRKGRQTTRTALADDHENNVSGGATVTSEIPEIKTTRAGRKKTTTDAKNVVDTTILSTTEATRTVPQTATTPSHEDSTTTPPSDYEDEPTSAETVTTKMVEAKTTRKMRRTTVFDDAASETTTLTTTRAASKVTMPLLITTTEFEEYEDETTGTSLIGFDTTKLFYRDPNAPMESNMPNFSNPDAFTFELLSGSSLPIGKTLWNNDTRNVKFELRSDGNAVLVRLCDDTVIWSTGTATTPDLAAHSVEMQTNGNLVIRSSLGIQIWSSDTADARFAGSSLRVTQAGALCLFKDDLCWWESGGLSLCKAPQSAQFSSGTVFMKSGSRLQLGHSLFNPRKNCRLSLHLNGDLVLRQQCDVTETWSIRHGTGKVLNLGDGSNDKVQEFVMTKEGHLVVHRPDGGEDFKIMIPNAHGADLRLSSSCHIGLLTSRFEIVCPNQDYVFVLPPETVGWDGREGWDGWDGQDGRDGWHG
ncbi:putative Zinc metalloproteinase nas-4 [Hypsibius exemplaris]|uniref:Metalloendopeptidase n=1 Tax=Hypsibius exemplaris TaxID=2072580 RepID=A0A1W0WNH8_HYPEX|nr:putative Zinc metalloproteinase nas-4 [Hypsibius exemplaris]